MDITELSAADLSESIHRRDVSCREVMDAYLDRIDQQNPAVNAIVSRRDTVTSLMAEAARRDERDRRRACRAAGCTVCRRPSRTSRLSKACR